MSGCVSGASHTRLSGTAGAQQVLRAVGPGGDLCGTVWCQQPPDFLSAFLPPFAELLTEVCRFPSLRLGPAPCSCSDKLTAFSPQGPLQPLSQPSWFKGHWAAPPMKLGLSFASIKFSINLVSSQYRFSLQACL